VGGDVKMILSRTRPETGGALQGSLSGEGGRERLWRPENSADLKTGHPNLLP